MAFTFFVVTESMAKHEQFLNRRNVGEKTLLGCGGVRYSSTLLLIAVTPVLPVNGSP